MCVLREICWQARGGKTRLYLCWQCHGHESHESQTSPPPTKGCREPGQETAKNPVNLFFALESGSACGPSTVFFSQFLRTIFHSVFHVLFRPFFHDSFFAHIFWHFLSLLFSHIFSHFRFSTFFFHISEVCCQKTLRSVQPLHCITVPETGHTSTYRSCPPLLTQYSHKAQFKRQHFGKIRCKFSLCWQSAIIFS